MFILSVIDKVLVESVILTGSVFEETESKCYFEVLEEFTDYVYIYKVILRDVTDMPVKAKREDVSATFVVVTVSTSC